MLYSIIASVLTFHPVDGKRPARKKIAVIPGDGIGKDVIPQAINVIQASGAPLDLTEFDIFLRDIKCSLETLDVNTIDSKKCHVR